MLREEARRLFIAETKSFVMFCRSFQDAVYAVLLESTGKPSGRYSSLSDAIKKTNPIVADVLSSLPGYADWFRFMKSYRDMVKLGAIAEIHGLGFDAKVVLQDASSGSFVAIGSVAFGFSDMVFAVSHSADLVEAAYAKAAPV